MHPSFDQLLSLREDAPEDEVAVHVRDCAECHARVESARNIASRLRALPTAAEPPARWLAIRTAFLAQAATSRRSGRRPGWFLPAASAAIVLVAVLLTVSSHGPRQGSDSRAGTGDPSAKSSPAQGQLVAESQRLEAMLATLPEETRVTRAGTALTVADLEDRIRWVDYRLNFASEAGINPRQEDLLWRERVELLNSLVAVRYADARTRAF